MTDSTNETESKTDIPKPPSNTGYEAPAETPEPVSTEPEFDELGYEVEKKAEETPAPAEEPEVKEEDDKVEKPATGYGEEDESDEPEVKEEPKKEETTSDDGETLKEETVKEILGELPEGFDSEKVSKFALDNGMTEAQLKAYVEMAKSDAEAIKADQEARTKAQRKQWSDDLKADPEFGGENFAKSVHNAEKVLEKYFPEFKKVLTERGGMLPPYIMKDFAKLYKTMNPTTNLVHGNASEVPETKNFLDEMYQ